MKEIELSSKVTDVPDSQIFEDYWAMERQDNGMKTFVFTDLQIYEKYKDQYCYQDLLNMLPLAIFKVHECAKCSKPFDVAMNSREHYFLYTQDSMKFCRICENQIVALTTDLKL